MSEPTEDTALVETVARAIWEDDGFVQDHIDDPDNGFALYQSNARAAIAAIQASPDWVLRERTATEKRARAPYLTSGDTDPR